MKFVPVLFVFIVSAVGNCYTQSFETETGALVPPFVLIDNEGMEVQLSDFTGKLLILDFWASYCGPCRQQAETFFKPLYAKLSSTEFEILGISIDKDTSRWIEALARDKMNWPQVCLALNANTVKQDYNIKHLPTTMVIDRNGKLLGRNLAKFKMIETIHKNLELENVIAIQDLYDATSNFKDWEEFLEDLHYEIDKYVYENTIYPLSAKENGITGSIPVMLTIGTDFKLERPIFLKTIPGSKGQDKVKRLGHGCEEEVERVIESLKTWKSFPYVQKENVYSNLTYFHFPPKKPVRQDIILRD